MIIVPRAIVIHYLKKQLTNQNGNLAGFVVMPDHVHAMVRFQEKGMLSTFMCQWKSRVPPATFEARVPISRGGRGNLLPGRGAQKVQE